MENLIKRITELTDWCKAQTFHIEARVDTIVFDESDRPLSMSIINASGHDQLSAVDPDGCIAHLLQAVPSSSVPSRAALKVMLSVLSSDPEHLEAVKGYLRYVEGLHEGDYDMEVFEAAQCVQWHKSISLAST